MSQSESDQTLDRIRSALRENTAHLRPNGTGNTNSNNTVVVPYEPEVSRYGGPGRIGLAEAHFHASSTWVLRYATIWGKSESAKLLTAGMCMVLMLRAAFSINLCTFAETQSVANMFIVKLTRSGKGPRNMNQALNHQWSQDSDIWLRYLSAAVSGGADLAAPAPVAFDEWKVLCEEYCRQLDASGTTSGTKEKNPMTLIINSQIHMHNNRLGLDNLEEARVAHCVLKYMANFSIGDTWSVNGPPG